MTVPPSRWSWHGRPLQPVQFERQGPAEEGADEDEPAEHSDIDQGGLECDCPDHVPRHEKLQSDRQGVGLVRDPVDQAGGQPGIQQD